MKRTNIKKIVLCFILFIVCFFAFGDMAQASTYRKYVLYKGDKVTDGRVLQNRSFDGIYGTECDSADPNIVRETMFGDFKAVGYGTTTITCVIKPIDPQVGGTTTTEYIEIKVIQRTPSEYNLSMKVGQQIGLPDYLHDGQVMCGVVKGDAVKTIYSGNGVEAIKAGSAEVACWTNMTNTETKYVIKINVTDPSSNPGVTPKVYNQTVDLNVTKGSEGGYTAPLNNVASITSINDGCSAVAASKVRYENGYVKFTTTPNKSAQSGICHYKFTASGTGATYNYDIAVNIKDSGPSDNKTGNPPSGTGPALGYRPVPETNIDYSGIIDPIDGLCDKYTVTKKVQAYTGEYSTPTSHHLNLYEAKDHCEGETYISICLDPTKSPPNATTTYVKVAPVNPLDSVPAFWFGEPAQTAYEAFVLSIVQQYYDSIVGSQDYEAAAQLAFRTYFANLGQSNIKEMYVKLAKAWLGQDPSYSWTGGNQTVYNLGKEMYDYGIVSGDSCLAGNCSVNITDVGLTMGEFDKADCEVEDGKVTKYLEGKVHGLEGYDGGIKITKFIGPEQFEYELEIDGVGYKVGSTLPSSGSTYRFKVTASSEVWSKLKANDLIQEIGFEVEATSKKDFHNVIAIKPENGNYQRMILIRKAVPSKLKFVLGKLSDLTCGGCFVDPELNPDDPAYNEERFIEECCEDPKLDPGKKEELCPPPPDVCAVAAWAPVCDDSAEETIYYYYEGIPAGSEEIDYENCVIDKDDGAKNSNNLKDLAPGDNPYCTVSCKEDWDFTLPGKKYATAGRYFLLSVPKIQGVRTCVTSLVIKNDDTDGRDTFENDLKRYVQQMVDAYNDLMEANAYWFDYDEAEVQEEEKICKIDGVSSCTDATQNGKQDTDKDTVQYKQTSGGTIYKQIELVQEARYIPETGKIKDQLIIKPAADGKTESKRYGKIEAIDSEYCGAQTCSFDKIDYATAWAAEKYQGQATRAAASYADAVSKIQEALTHIRQCSNWENEYNWSPEIRYTYAESYYMDLINGNNLFNVEPVNPAGAEVPNHQGKNGDIYCTGDAKSDDYECTNHDDSASSYTHDLDIFKATGDMCAGPSCSYTVPWSVNTSNFGSTEVPYNTSVMKVRGHAQENIKIKGVWYTLHDTGDMMYDSSESASSTSYETVMDEEGNPQSTDRTGKVMPVRVTTPAGVYEYQLMFTGVGQYNDDGSTGRVIGGTNGKGAKSTFSALTSYYNLSQTYICHYEVKETLCTCCGDDIEYEIVSLLICPSGDCGKVPSNYLYENGDLAFFTRAISVNDMNPNRRNLGSNWTTEKGEATLNAIQGKGEEIYEKPEYSYTITSQGLAALKNQNSAYASFDLNCNEAGMDCTSPFLESIGDYKGITVNATPSNDSKFVHYNGTSWK